MAAIARVCGQPIGMAGLTASISISMIYGEGMRTIICCGFPCICGVTGGAVGAELTGVFLGFGVAIYTRSRYGYAGMVKGRVFPIRGGMAGFALRTKLSAVFIILFMAGVAIFGSAFVNVIDMAVFTGDFPMFTL